MEEGVWLARVLHKEGDTVTLEVYRPEYEVTINEGDEYVTLAFPNGSPWETGR